MSANRRPDPNEFVEPRHDERAKNKGTGRTIKTRSLTEQPSFVRSMNEVGVETVHHAHMQNGEHDHVDPNDAGLFFVHVNVAKCSIFAFRVHHFEVVETFGKLAFFQLVRRLVRHTFHARLAVRCGHTFRVQNRTGQGSHLDALDEGGDGGGDRIKLCQDEISCENRIIGIWTSTSKRARFTDFERKRHTQRNEMR